MSDAYLYMVIIAGVAALSFTCLNGVLARRRERLEKILRIVNFCPHCGRKINVSADQRTEPTPDLEGQG